MLDIKIYIFTVLTEAHTRMPKKPTRSTKSRITFLIFVHKLWFLSEVKRSSSSTSSNSSSSGSVPDKRAGGNREMCVYFNTLLGKLRFKDHLTEYGDFFYLSLFKSSWECLGYMYYLCLQKQNFFSSKQKMKMPVPVLNVLTWKNNNQAIPQK